MRLPSDAASYHMSNRASVSSTPRRQVSGSKVSFGFLVGSLQPDDCSRITTGNGSSLPWQGWRETPSRREHRTQSDFLLISSKRIANPISAEGTRGSELALHFNRRFVMRRERPGAVTMRELQTWFGQWKGEGIRAGGSQAEWWNHHSSFDDWRRSELDRLLEAGLLEQGCTEKRRQ